jgi:hypothetical protein
VRGLVKKIDRLVTIVALLACPLVLPGCGGVGTVSSGTVSPDEEYAVYSVVIDEMYGQEWVKTIIIHEESRHLLYIGLHIPEVIEVIHSDKAELFPGPFITWAAEHIPGIDRSTVEDFVAKPSAKIMPRFRTNKPCKVIGDSSRPDGGWDAFHRKYPSSQGLLRLSRVGFSKDGMQAMVYIGNLYNGRDGGGHFVVLSKESGQWVVKSKVQLWIA